MVLATTFFVLPRYTKGDRALVFICCEIFQCVIQHIKSLTPAASLLLFVHMMFAAVPTIKWYRRTGFVQVSSLLVLCYGIGLLKRFWERLDLHTLSVE